MIEQLPITIKASSELVILLPKLNAVSNRLEAQFNFQSMLANWYGDEKKRVRVNVELQTPESFLKLHAQYQSQVGFTVFSDDVFISYQAPSVVKSEAQSEINNEIKDETLTCIVAITANELTLLSEQKKLLAPYVEKKLHKVLNLIGEQLNLPSLPPLSSS